MQRKRGARLRLEAARIAGLEAVDGQRTDYADTLQRGLVLRVTPSGIRTWVLLYRAEARVRRLKLGRWPDVSLAQARLSARRARGLVDAGHDPHEERVADRRARAAARLELTLGVVLERFGAHLAAGEHYGRTTRVQWPQMMRKDLLPAIGRFRPADPAVRGALALAIQGVIDRGSPAQARRTLELARRAWSWGVERGLIPIAAPYPFLGLRGPRARARERYYLPAEIAALWAAVGGERAVYRDWWRLLWWTGARSSEVAELRWEELEPDTGRWTRLRTKGGRPLVLVLPRQAREMLEGRRTARGLVFPSPRRPGAALTMGSRDHMARRLRAVASDYRHHDVRRTVRTGLAELGVRHEVAELVLGHSRGGLVETYDRHLYQAEIAEALQRWADRLEGLTARTAPGC